ncbi:hydrogenase nickel incorporation protein HypB [Corynebacterium poyangense]|uniref:Hydrogenase nickel incorporation protein HypB n=1 Tax=Corynebacterium poyangense TaxID=2684405 RepID=A0A7H0SR55_9CORY|nr:hydrogenase nickel incorporation protein HypB [Corynebacterium poyangense]QNQ91030.1 hydrogenase nickel incorporation protein HypB [Corynebacterium poyangense]
MGRFHRHDDGSIHKHHTHHAHDGEHSHPNHDHGDHSGYETGRERISVLEDIFHENDHCAEENRAALDRYGVHCINVMSSPGAGKTELLVQTLKALSGEFRVGVVEGDIETSMDADRLNGLGAQVSLLNTGNGFGGECHLDAPMVHRALKNLDLSQLDLLLVENVGNLVCPAEFEVGEHRKAMVYSLTEGEDKPLKYPVMFRSVGVVVINKMDLLPHLDVDVELFRKNLRQVNPDCEVIELSAKTGEGIEEWLRWVKAGIPMPLAPKD